MMKKLSFVVVLFGLFCNVAFSAVGQVSIGDSNIAGLGTDLERSVKLTSARTERAWAEAGKAVGLLIWRIEKFKVVAWPKVKYGQFHEGDSYIILNTRYKSSTSRDYEYDLHFWIGKDSTQDEYGAAAYKTVELDTYLGDKPKQYREVQGEESSLFKSHFNNNIRYLPGGMASGFRKVEPVVYLPRLIKFSGSRQNVKTEEIPLKGATIDGGNCYILDLGLTVYQLNGAGSNKDNRYKALEFLQKIKSERGRVKTETFEGSEMNPDHIFMKTLKRESGINFEHGAEYTYSPTLFQSKTVTNRADVVKAKEGNIRRSDLKSDDAFVLDTGKDLFVWYGSTSTKDERDKALSFAHNHLRVSKHSMIPMNVIDEKQLTSPSYIKPAYFDISLSA
ncbi:hypothetical protein HELRODRAFT_186285 [Helobdella robusta]|uniref:Actin-modulator n=1 Tax=Helobdella robusta TaxID=6412 RepID=T1FNX1_HELRO|nr:hypothetical protein HELRODRAFT_186285 [Helobdella robusta]ESO09824.1 hypothetical protein HELRODRAFT_186285 [Helobdella robusta]